MSITRRSFLAAGAGACIVPASRAADPVPKPRNPIGVST